MVPLMVPAVALALAAVGLAALVAALYARNLAVVASPFTAALAVFALASLMAAVLAAQRFHDMMPAASSQRSALMLAEAAMQTVAFGALAWAALRSGSKGSAEG